jgi:hypothetical protein
VVLSRWQGGLAAAVVTLAACVLVLLDVTDAALRAWWDGHALTTDTLAGLLVLMITALIVDQVVRLKQGSKRARAVAVQVAIVLSQANRAAQTASQVLAGAGDRGAAFEEFRAYTMMLLSVAPTLIEVATSRAFLERAQSLNGELARALNVLDSAPGPGSSPASRIDDALRGLRSASAPLLRNLDPAVQSAVRGDARA